MPVSVGNLQTLRTYVRGVLGKAKHHAPNVDEIVLALAGGVISRQGQCRSKFAPRQAAAWG